MLRPGGHHCPVVVAVSRSTRPLKRKEPPMKTPTTKTRCETVDLTVPWVDDNGQLNVTVGDLVTDAGKFEVVTEIHWNPALDMRVAVGYEGRGSLVFKDSAETVKVHRYIETTEE